MIRSRTALALLPALLAAPPASPPDPASPPAKVSRSAELEARLAATVSRSAALATVRDLTALGPRMGGTPSGDRAAAYVAARMLALGISVETTLDPEQETHWEASWTVDQGGAPLASAWPWGFSRSLARVSAPLRADLRAGPEGEEPMRLSREQTAGAVILTARSIREVYADYAREGALALLTDAPRDPNRFTDWSPIEPIPRSVREKKEGRQPPVFALSYNDGARLRRALLDPNGASVTVALDSTVGPGRPRSVLGTLPGSGRRADQTLLLCAHGDSDSGGPGADDNASGVAALLEVARALATHRDELPADRPAVVLAVWGSEYDSTQAWIRARGTDLPGLQAVLNYDQCGAGAERDALYYEGNDIPFVVPLLRTLEDVARDYAGQEGFWGPYTSVPALGGTDAYAFLPRRHKGIGLATRDIPASTIFTAAWGRPDRRRQTSGWTSPGWPEGDDLLIDYTPQYHSSGDTPDRTTEREPWNMERCARLALLGLYRLMISTE